MSQRLLELAQPKRYDNLDGSPCMSRLALHDHDISPGPGDYLHESIPF